MILTLVPLQRFHPHTALAKEQSEDASRKNNCRGKPSCPELRATLSLTSRKWSLETHFNTSKIICISAISVSLCRAFYAIMASQRTNTLITYLRATDGQDLLVLAMARLPLPSLEHPLAQPSQLLRRARRRQLVPAGAPHASEDRGVVLRVIPHHVEGFVRCEPLLHGRCFPRRDLERPKHPSVSVPL